MAIKVKHGVNITKQQIVLTLSTMTEFDTFEFMQLIHYLRELEIAANS